MLQKSELIFAAMELNRKIFSLFLAAVMAFAMLFQSVHGAAHLAEEISAEHCDHQYQKGRNEVNHSHHKSDHCFTCEFTFAGYLLQTPFKLPETASPLNAKYSFAHCREITQFFRGSLFSHRGPPSVIA